MSPRRREEVVRITTASTAPADDLAQRQRRYLIAMTIRTVCFIGAVAVGPGWLRWVLLAGAVFLPYTAVISANASAPREDDFELEELGARALPMSEGHDVLPGEQVHDDDPRPR